MAKKKVYLSTKSGRAWKASRVPPSAGRQAVEISTDLGFAWKADGPVILIENAFSLIKAKLESGLSTSALVIGDSTAYSPWGPYYKFFAWLGRRYDATVRLYPWAEWDGDSPDGPKEYDDPVVLHSGSSQTLDVYLAALPGDVAAAMFDSSRKPEAINAIPSPDVVILHHGHNMQNFNVPIAGEYAGGRGMFFAAVAAITTQWPGVSVVLCTQNPWRDNDNYAKVYDSQTAVGALLSGLTIVDSYRKFVAAGKAANLYRSDDATGVHPSDSAENSAGASLVCDAHVEAFVRAAVTEAFFTADWPSLPAANLISNGTLETWVSALPTGYQALNNGLVTKDEVNVYDDAPWAASVVPNIPTGNQNSGLSRPLSAGERAAIAGKTISVAVRITKALATQRRPYIRFITQNPAGGGNLTYVMADYITRGSSVNFDGAWWAVAAGIKVGPNPDANTGIAVFPAFSGSAPAVNDPLVCGNFVVTEGALPLGKL